MVLRDGHSITEEDVHMRLDGFYVPETGRLHAVLEPAVPVRQPPPGSQQPGGGVNYR